MERAPVSFDVRQPVVCESRESFQRQGWGRNLESANAAGGSSNSWHSVPAASSDPAGPRRLQQNLPEGIIVEKTFIGCVEPKEVDPRKLRHGGCRSRLRLLSRSASPELCVCMQVFRFV